MATVDPGDGYRPSGASGPGQIGPDDLQVSVIKEQVRSAPDIEMHGEEFSQGDESTLHHHFDLNYTPPGTESGRRLARR